MKKSRKRPIKKPNTILNLASNRTLSTSCDCRFSELIIAWRNIFTDVQCNAALADLFYFFRSFCARSVIALFMSELSVAGVLVLIYILIRGVSKGYVAGYRGDTGAHKDTRKNILGSSVLIWISMHVSDIHITGSS